MRNRACHAEALSHSALSSWPKGLPNGRRRAPLDETRRFFTKDHRVIVPLTVNDILDEQIAMKLA